MNLSQHFTLDELTLSQAAARAGLENKPGPKELENLKRLAESLEQLRAALGKPILISSGFRSLAVNQLVGGSLTSAHCKGLAADINCPGMTPHELAEAIRKTGVPFDQLILEYDRWVHFGLSDRPPRGMLLTIRSGTGYLPGLLA